MSSEAPVASLSTTEGTVFNQPRTSTVSECETSVLPSAQVDALKRQLERMSQDSPSSVASVTIRGVDASDQSAVSAKDVTAMKNKTNTTTSSPTTSGTDTTTATASSSEGSHTSSTRASRTTTTTTTRTEPLYPTIALTSPIKIALSSIGGHLASSSAEHAIPASPTDRLLSPTTRRLRKHGKAFADDNRYKLVEGAGTIAPRSVAYRGSSTSSSSGGTSSGGTSTSGGGRGLDGSGSDSEYEEEGNVIYDSNDSDTEQHQLEEGYGLPIVLGCSWPIRRKILAENSWKFSVLESDYNFEREIGATTHSPVHVAMVTAHALASHFDDDTTSTSTNTNTCSPVVLLTVAQVFIVEGIVHHPSRTQAEVVELLRSVSNKTVIAHTAVVATVCPSTSSSNNCFQVVEEDKCEVEFSNISHDLAVRVAKRTFPTTTTTTSTSSTTPTTTSTTTTPTTTTPTASTTPGLPIRDPEIQLRYRLISGSEDSLLGMPLVAADRAVSAVIAKWRGNKIKCS